MIITRTEISSARSTPEMIRREMDVDLNTVAPGSLQDDIHVDARSRSGFESSLRSVSFLGSTYVLRSRSNDEPSCNHRDAPASFALISELWDDALDIREFDILFE